MKLFHKNPHFTLNDHITYLSKNRTEWRYAVMDIAKYLPEDQRKTSLLMKVISAALMNLQGNIYWFKPGRMLIASNEPELDLRAAIEEIIPVLKAQYGDMPIDIPFNVACIQKHWDDFSTIKTALIRGHVNTEKAEEEEKKLKININPKYINLLAPVRKNRKKPIVMIVEDDPTMQKLITLAIDDSFDVVCASTLKYAKDIYESKLPDMVLMDIILPDGNGLDLVEQISMHDSSAYIVMLSGDTCQCSILRCKKYGARGFIAKPMTTKIVQQHLNKFKSQYKKPASLRAMS